VEPANAQGQPPLSGQKSDTKPPIAELELIALAGNPEDLRDQVSYPATVAPIE